MKTTRLLLTSLLFVGASMSANLALAKGVAIKSWYFGKCCNIPVSSAWKDTIGGSLTTTTLRDVYELTCPKASVNGSHLEVVGIQTTFTGSPNLKLSAVNNFKQGSTANMEKFADVTAYRVIDNNTYRVTVLKPLPASVFTKVAYSVDATCLVTPAKGRPYYSKPKVVQLKDI